MPFGAPGLGHSGHDVRAPRCYVILLIILYPLAVGGAMAADRKTVELSLGALRCLGKAAQIGRHKSEHFAQAALSLVALGSELDHESVAPSVDVHM